MKKKKTSRNKDKKDNICSRNYKESWRYLKESKNYIWFATGLFILFILIGFLFPVFFVDQVKETLIAIIGLTEGMNILELIIFIFFNNSMASLFGMILGVVLGIMPLISLVKNGYILGFVSNAVVNEVGYVHLWKILPHGIFELPAILISLGLGLKFGMFIFSKKPKKELIKRLVNSLKVFLFIILPLLAVAAVIEGALIGIFG